MPATDLPFRIRKRISVDETSGVWRWTRNTDGAAAAAVGLLARKEVGVVLAPRLGPNAVSALAAANMKAYLSEGATAADCAARYLSGEAKALG